MAKKFKVEIQVGVNQSDIAQGAKGFTRLGLSAEDAQKRVEGLAKKSDASSERVNAAALRAAAGFEKLARTTENGGVGAERALSKLVDRTRELETAIERAKRAGSPVPPDAVATLQAVQAQTDGLIRRIGQQRAISEASGRALGDATRAAGGFGGGVRSVSDILGGFNPKLEQLAIRATLAAGAIAVVDGAYRRTVSGAADFAKEVGASKDSVDRFVESLPKGLGPLSQLSFWIRQVTTNLREFKEATKGAQVAPGETWFAKMDRDAKAFALQVTAMRRSVTGDAAALGQQAELLERAWHEAVREGAMGEEGQRAFAQRGAQMAEAFRIAGAAIPPFITRLEGIQVAHEDAILIARDRAAAEKKAFSEATQAAKRYAEMLAEANFDVRRDAQRYGDQAIRAQPVDLYSLDPLVAKEKEIARERREAAEDYRRQWRRISEEQEEYFERQKEALRQQAADIKRYVQEPLVGAWQTMQDQALDAITAVVMRAKVSFSDLVKSWLAMWVRALAEWLVRYVTTQRIAQATNAGLSGNTSGGGGGLTGSLTNMGMTAATSQSTSGAATNWSAVAGYALIAYGLFVVYKGFIEDHKRRFAGVTLGDQGQLLSSAQHGKKYMDGLLKTVDALLSSLRAWLKEFDVQMAKFASITIEADKSGYSVRSGAAIIGHFKTAEEAISAAQAYMVRFGEFAESVPALVRGAIRASDLNMDSITENVNFARTLLTQNMEQIALAIHDATELFMEQFQRSMELFGRAGREFNPAALLEATGSAIAFFTNSLQSLYDQLTGRKEDPRIAAERQRVAYNAQRAIMVAQITLLIEEIRARIALYQAQMLTLQGLRNSPGFGGGGGAGSGGGGGGGHSGFGGGQRTPYMSARSGPVTTKGGGVLVIDERNPSNDPQLAALLQVLDNLVRALAGIPGEIGPGGVKIPKPGGGAGGGGVTRAQIEEEIRSVTRAYEMRGMGEAGKRFAEINQKWADLSKGLSTHVRVARKADETQEEYNKRLREAHKHARRNAEELERIAAARAKEIEMLQEETRASYAKYLADFGKTDFTVGMERFLADLETIPDEILPDVDKAIIRTRYLAEQLAGVAQSIREFSGDPTAGVAAIFAQAEEYRKNIQALLDAGGIAAEEAAGLMRQIAEGIEYQKAQMLGGIMDKLFGYLQGNADFEEKRKAWELKKLDADFKLYEAQLRAIGAWDEEMADFVRQARAAAGALIEAGNIINGFTRGRPGYQLPPWAQPGGGTPANDNRQRALDMLARYQNEGLSRWHQALRALNEDFEFIRRTLGNTPEVAQAYAAAMERLRTQFLQGIRDYYDAMTIGGNSPLTIAQQYQAAAAQYAQRLAAVQGGDLSQADALRSAAEQYQQLASQMFGTSTAGFAGIFSQIRADLAALLGIGGNAAGGGNNLLQGPAQWFAQGADRTIAATDNVARTIDLQTARQSAESRALIDEVRMLRQEVRDLRAAAPPTSFGYGNGSGFAAGDSPRWPGRRAG